MRLFHRAAAPEEVVSVELEPTAPTLPSDPAELGLLLRATRERLGIGLEAIRDEIDVPVVDLDALERGQLEVLHTQQAAVIALWRYAERLGLPASDLVGVLRSHWPNRMLSVNAIAARRGVTPIAELRSATQLLSPISDPVSLGTMSIGLSQGTKEVLEARSAKHLFALQLLAPAIALQRSQLGVSSVAALRAADRVEVESPPQLSTGGLYEDPGSHNLGSTTLDDRAVLEQFMASTAPSDEDLLDEEGLVDEEALGDEEDIDETHVFDALVAEIVTEAEEADLVDEADLVVDDEPTVAGDDEDVRAEAAAPPEIPQPTTEVTDPSENAVEAQVAEPAPWVATVTEMAVPAVVSPPVASFPLPSIPAPAPEPAPLIPSFSDLIGRAQNKNRWVRYVSKFVAERLGVAPGGTGPTPPSEPA